MEPAGERSTKKGVKECKVTGAAGKALKSLSGAGSRKCGVMVRSSPVPPFLVISWLLILITEHSGGFLFLWLLMKANMGRISLPAQCCCDLLSHVPAQAVPTFPSKRILYFAPTAQIFLRWSSPTEDHHNLFPQQREVAEGWFRALQAPGILESSAEPSSAGEVSMQDIHCPGFRLVEPRDEFVCFTQTSRNTNSVRRPWLAHGPLETVIAKKYISRRVPTLPLPAWCADREEDESSLQFSSLTPTHPPTHKFTPQGFLLWEGVAGSLQIPSVIMYIPVPVREITGKIRGWKACWAGGF